MRDIGHGDRVTPGNAFDGDQLKEIAKEAIDGGRIGKSETEARSSAAVASVARVAPEEALGMMGAKFSRRRGEDQGDRGDLRRGDEHTAAAAEGVDMRAAQGVVAVVDLGELPDSRVRQGKCTEHPPPRFFHKSVIPWEFLS